MSRSNRPPNGRDPWFDPNDPFGRNADRRHQDLSYDHTGFGPADSPFGQNPADVDHVDPNAGYDPYGAPGGHPHPGDHYQYPQYPAGQNAPQGYQQEPGFDPPFGNSARRFEPPQFNGEPGGLSGNYASRDPFGRDVPPAQGYGPSHGDGFGNPATDGWNQSQYGHQEPSFGRYDLGTYMPNEEANAPQPGGWGPPNGAGDLSGGRFDGYQQDYQPGSSGGALAMRDDYEDDEYDYEDEEPPRSWARTFMIAAGALMGAVIVGGGLAYAYATFIAPSGQSNNPLIRSADGPAKVAPEDPGGQQFANTDSTLLNRLDRERGAATGEQRVRPVSTLIVRRDGTLVEENTGAGSGSGGSAATTTASRSAETVAIPGLTIVAPSEPTPSRPPVINSAAPTAVPPVRTAPAEAPPVTQAPPASSVAIPIPGRNTWIDRSQRAAAAAPAASEPRVEESRVAETSSASVAGYVAVLASKNSRIEALETFADLRLKYENALQGRVPDIQAADLTDRGLGTMYRVVVGPPGSRDAANTVCNRLKEAGYAGCWVKAY